MAQGRSGDRQTLYTLPALAANTWQQFTVSFANWAWPVSRTLTASGSGTTPLPPSRFFMSTDIVLVAGPPPGPNPTNFIGIDAGANRIPSVRRFTALPLRHQPSFIAGFEFHHEPVGRECRDELQLADQRAQSGRRLLFKNLCRMSARHARGYLRTASWPTARAAEPNSLTETVQSYLLGVQYDSCCWAFRVLGGRTFTALNQNGSPMYSTSINVQWVLKGLANIDPNSVGTKLAEQIPGYQDPFADKSGIQMLR